jgi:hypothetical protein
MEKKNLSEIIYQLKLQYNKIFGEKYDNKLDAILNDGAKKIKSGRFVGWKLDKEGNKVIR